MDIRLSLRTISLFGKRSLAISQMAHRLSSTNLFLLVKKNGDRNRALFCCFHMDTKDKARSIRADAWNDLSSFVVRTIFKSQTRQHRRNILIFCAVRFCKASELLSLL